jgi:hypothetical protein
VEAVTKAAAAKQSKGGGADAACGSLQRGHRGGSGSSARGSAGGRG